MLFPADAIEIIFHRKNVLNRINQDITQKEENAFLEGQQRKAIYVQHTGPINTIGITLYPWATYILFNTPAAVFTDKKFPIRVIDPTLIQLYDLLQEAAPAQIPLICNNYFFHRIKKSKLGFSDKDDLLIELMSETKGITNLDMVKGNWTLSTRYFEKKCLELLGIKAGEVLRKRKMKKAISFCMQEDFISFTDVAHRAGYYDQSHFIHECQYYFHQSPKHLFKHPHHLLPYFV